MSGAAFFDLDRTLLRGSSGPTIGRALRELGVVERGPVPGEGVFYQVFDFLGETRPSMFLARQLARLARGWPQQDVRLAGARAAEHLVPAVQPFARPLLDEHQEGGRPLVLATTTPYDMIRPLADALGFDDVVATRYGVDGGGLYDGTIDGELVWGRGKLRAVEVWAAEHDVELEKSWAYSDSFYDTPLLSAVGHPVAVNPDPRLTGVALLRRWPVLHLDVPAGVPKLPLLGAEPIRVLMEVLRPGLQPWLLPWMRVDVDGVDHIPATGPAILVANHRSYIDPLALGLAIARSGRPMRFLGKREVFDAPVVGQIVRSLGAIPVDREGASSEALLAAQGALAAGEMVVILPQGTIPRGRAFFEPTLEGRWGAARLAAATRAPVVPFGVWGTEHVWPRSERVPRLWNVLNPPTVTIRAGAPVTLKHSSPGADTRRIMDAIRDQLPPEAQVAGDPTPEELARTYPPGRAPQEA
jgi:putative phosphoserine phosphatase / 1-acylglycerol-3-phosphate O-acyltransferase